MPDLDQIKQAELGAGTGADGSPGPVAQSRRPRGCRDHVNRAARHLEWLTLNGLAMDDGGAE